MKTNLKGSKLRAGFRTNGYNLRTTEANLKWRP